MKNLLLVLIVGTLLMSCSTREDEYRDWKDQDNPRIETLIEKFGDPNQILNPTERYKTTIVEFNDMYSPEFKTREEYENYYKDYFKKEKEIFKKWAKESRDGKSHLGFNRGYYNEDVSDLKSKQKNTFTYKESLYDRIGRLHLFLSSNWGPQSVYNLELYRNGVDWNHLVYPGDVNTISYYFTFPNTDGEEGDEVTFYVSVDNETGDIVYDEINYVQKYSFCDCLKFVGDELPKSCKEQFKSSYGTEDPSADQMREDYRDCTGR